MIGLLFVLFLLFPYGVDAAQPVKQAGTGTYDTSSGGYYVTQGYTLMFGGYTTSVSINDNAVLYSDETSSPIYPVGFNVVTLAGNERHARGSTYVRKTDGSFVYYNYNIRINPPNFNKDSLVKGRSLLDNMYLEGATNDSDLSTKLSNGGTGWINAIISGRVGGSTQPHSTMYTGRLWGNGSSNYTVPERSYSTSAIRTAFTWSSNTYNILALYYDNDFVFPKIPEVKDNTPPSHIEHSLSGANYQNGNDYWVRPNNGVWVRLRQYDATGNLYNYIRLDGSPYGNGVDARAQHDLTQHWQHNYHWATNPNVVVAQAGREELTKNYAKVAWNVVAKTHAHTYDIQYYYRDTENNTVGYNNTGMRLRVDGVAPEHNSHIITGYRYQNGDDYWVKPNDQVYITFRQYDPHSGNKYQYLSLLGSGVDVRSLHSFDASTTYNQQFFTSPNVQVNSALREEDTTYGKVKWGVLPKTHGDGYNIQYYYCDNVENCKGYIDTGMDLWADGVAPTVSFRNSGDTADFTSRGWSNAPIEVRLKFNDPHSGFKRYRYAWTTSTATPTSWSGWSTSNNSVVTKTGYGQWYLHIQGEDNVGNIVTTRSAGTFNYNREPVANFTWNPSTIYNDTNVTFTNGCSDPDGNILTAQWAYQQPGSTNWVNFSTSMTTVAKVLNIKGDWNIRLTCSDGIFNTPITKIVKVLNRPPVAEFTFDKPKYWIGDTAIVKDASFDVDGDVLTYKYSITAPNNRLDTKTVKDFSYIFDQVGDFIFTLEVTDPDGAKDTITKIVFANDLTITGTVGHTPQWLEIHQKKGNLPEQFYSGENLLLAANITDYPANYVKATLNGRLVSGSMYSRVQPLTKVSNTVYDGVMDGEDFVEKYPLRKGVVPIEFEVQFANGQIRKAIVEIEVIGNALEAYGLHRLY